jgi:hypothetical protein
MPIETLHEGISVDFADVLLIINVFAIAMLFGVLYIDEIVASLKRAVTAVKVQSLALRLRFWPAASRTPD